MTQQGHQQRAALWGCHGDPRAAGRHRTFQSGMPWLGRRLKAWEMLPHDAPLKGTRRGTHRTTVCGPDRPSQPTAWGPGPRAQGLPRAVVVHVPTRGRWKGVVSQVAMLVSERCPVASKGSSTMRRDTRCARPQSREEQSTQAERAKARPRWQGCCGSAP